MDSFDRSFQAGFRTFIDMSSTQKNLARARTALVAAGLALLSGIANLAFRAGDPLLAQRAARTAAVKNATYDLARCKIYAPLDARVTNLTISERRICSSRAAPVRQA
jgi:multidrug resistance efflux pump